MVTPACAPVRNSMLTNAFTYLSIGTPAWGFLLHWRPDQHTTIPEQGVRVEGWVAAAPAVKLQHVKENRISQACSSAGQFQEYAWT